ncbi:PHD finger protein ALFIN-LIKE 7 [Sesamum angolense]|uniref:PHD finger protein ALFIN-LIKE n=1 Tax=Sesamum angolense TaxID=2727404 RepID=A0AAE1X7L5_9LAMI|nr:PHD finger protein ALFIN-LIKE 7 [Sesamum angolense]
MEGTPHPIPRTVEEVFNDFKGRRAGLIKALTTDVEKFYQQCDPEKENLCLYGLPNETWEVNLPVEEVPPELPEPALGINFARDGMQDKDWLSLVAVHSDSWLLSVSFYFGARFGFGKSERKRLFQMINELPTVFEVVTELLSRQRNRLLPKITAARTNLVAECHLDNLSPSPKELSRLQQRMRMRAERKKKMTNREQRYAVLAETITPTMNSGFAVMCAKDGSMGNV